MNPDQPHTDSSQQKQRKGDLPVDPALLSTLLVELNIARKHAALYGAGHARVAAAVNQLLSSVRKVHAGGQELRIGAAQKTLLVGEYALERGNPVFRELAEALFKKRIAAAAVAEGVTADEVLQFLVFLSSAGEVFSSPHITLTEIDFSAFGIDAEQQEREQARPLENYVSALLQGTLTADEAGSFVLTGRPADIARILNRAGGQAGSTASYERIIAAYLQGRETSRAERLARFEDLVRGLAPDIRQQIAALVLSRKDLEGRELVQLMKSLTLEDMEKVIAAVQAGGIPESIRNLLATLQSTGRPGQYFELVRGGPAVVSEFDVEVDQKVLGLFQDDRFPDFVSERYRSELRGLMQGPLRKAPELAGQVGRECAAPFIDRQFASLLLELVDSPLATDDDGAHLAAAAEEMVWHFLETGRFTDLVALHGTILSARAAGAPRSAALMRLFESPTFTEKFITAVTLWGRYDRTGVERLARSLAPVLRVPLIDALSEEDDLATRKFLLQLLTDLGPEVLDEAVNRLSDSRWYVVRNMLYLIRELKGTQHVERISALSRSENRRVAIEAVRTLFQFNVPTAKPALARLLQRPDPDLAADAMNLAGAFRVREAVPALLALLEAKDSSAAAEDRKVKVLKALNEIGDPQAVPALARFAAPKRFFFGGPSEKLRIAVYRGIENYPADAVRPLIEEGLRSGIGEIEAACRAWQRRKERGNA